MVGDIKQYGLDAKASDELYRPFLQAGFASRLMMRTAGEPKTMARELKEVVYSVDPDQPVSDIETLEERRRASMDSPRLTAMLLGLFAALALVITATGIGSLIAYAVSQRTHEIGIRMALGAKASSVMGMILRQGLVLVGVGALLGLAGAALFGGSLAHLLFETSSRDPLILLSVGVILLVATVVACYLPARRATRINPTEALRFE